MRKRRLIIKNQTPFLVKLKKRTITALLEYQIPLTVTSSSLLVLPFFSNFIKINCFTGCSPNNEYDNSFNGC